MIPRKRQRPNPATTSSTSLPASAPTRDDSTSSASRASQPHPSQAKDAVLGTGERERSSISTSSAKLKEVRKTQSWYGSWPRTPKATASTSLAKETASGGTVRSNKSANLTKYDSKIASDAASTQSNVETASVSSKMGDNQDIKSGSDGGKAGDTATSTEGNKSGVTTSESMTTSQQPDAEATTPKLVQPVAEAEGAPKPQTPSKPPSGWLSWISQTPFTDRQVSSASPVSPSQSQQEDDKEPRTPVPHKDTDADPLSTDTPQQTPQSTSWFSFWPGSGTVTSTEIGTKVANTEVSPVPPSSVTHNEGDNRSDEPISKASPDHEEAPAAGSTWAFWSRDSPKSKGRSAKSESGQIAVIGQGSEAHPTPMIEEDMSKTAKDGKEPKAQDVSAAAKSSWRKSKRLRPESMEGEPQSPTPGGNNQTQAQASANEEPAELSDTETKLPPKKTSKQAVQESETLKLPPNLLLPSFESTYQMKEDRSILKQLSQLLLRTSQPPANHVFRVKDPPRIRKAIAIGVHGFFPATYLRPMMGQPTGTSLRFATLCADAIRKWADAHGCSECEIEKVALEGEGKISERVENLWKLMLNWIEHIRDADLIIFSSHSQGVPVSIMLLEKLIDLGIITNARIGVCAMAGVALGPFPDYKSSILMGSAAELWEFGDPNSQNSKRFRSALTRVLDYGTRITFIGSIDDQIVPMESAVYSPATHPYIYRAVFIDGRTQAPDFIAHLVGFALKLRNLGVSDHGLIRELSVPLAGSLYSGEGHSRLYYDTAVYDLAISNTLETTAATLPRGGDKVQLEMGLGHGSSVQGVSSSSNSSSSGGGTGGASSPAGSNPYVLPWIMRGLLEENYVKTELSAETAELLQRFDDWKPTNKALKDVKYRLEAVRSKL